MWVCCFPHHVRMGFSGHFLARIQVEKLVHLWGSQSVSYLQVLHNKHLPWDRLIYCWPRSHLGLWVHLVLKPHLRRREKKGLWWRKTQCIYGSVCHNNHSFQVKKNFTLLSCISIRTSGFLPLPPPALPDALACLTGVWEGELWGVDLHGGEKHKN